LAEARTRHPDVRFQFGALPELERLADGSFVNVLCETVIMHLEAKRVQASVRKLLALLKPRGTLYLSWRVTEGADVRDEKGRLYSVFAPSLVTEVLSDAAIELNEKRVSASSGKIVHRIVARRR